MTQAHLRQRWKTEASNSSNEPSARFGADLSAPADNPQTAHKPGRQAGDMVEEIYDERCRSHAVTAKSHHNHAYSPAI